MQFMHIKLVYEKIIKHQPTSHFFFSANNSCTVHAWLLFNLIANSDQTGVDLWSQLKQLQKLALAKVVT